MQIQMLKGCQLNNKNLQSLTSTIAFSRNKLTSILFSVPGGSLEIQWSEFIFSKHGRSNIYLQQSFSEWKEHSD